MSAPGEPQHRQSSHHVVTATTGERFIVSSLASRKDTHVIAIDKHTGRLSFEGRRGVDTFTSSAEALAMLTGRGYELVESAQVDAVAIVGYIVLGSTGYLLVVTEATPSMLLFDNHTVYTIAASRWIEIPLEHPAPCSKAEAKAMAALMGYPLDSLHCFCESLDLTRPFPSVEPVDSPHPAFTYNSWLAEPFATLGLRGFCVSLIQGAAKSKTLVLRGEAAPQGRRVSLGLITKKSCLNPGTRYNARGLNDLGEPGNEMECELIMWWRADISEGEGEGGGKEKEGAEDGASGSTVAAPDFEFYSFCWRRGTVPVRFSNELKSSVAIGQAAMIIGDEPYKSVDKYFTRLLSRYGEVPISCINLLRVSPDSSETLLSEHFQTAVRSLRESMAMELSLINFDWHGIFKMLGPDETIGALWQQLSVPLGSMEVATGAIELVDNPRSPFSSFTYRLESEQGALLRWNCADSLDRTNVASFFASFQIVGEMLRRLGLGLAVPAQAAAALASDGRDNKWPLLRASLADLTSWMEPSVLAALAEMFVAHGDVCSTLYTNSPAAHSSMIRNYSPNVNAAPNNTLISIQRRFQNVVHDSQRHTLFTMWLGLDKARHFPSLVARAGQLPRAVWMSGPPASFLVKPLFSLTTGIGAASADDLLQHSDAVWECIEGSEVAELYIFLRRPCYVSELSVTLVQTAGTVAPVLVDVWAGEHVDSCRILYQALALPAVKSGTRLTFRIGAASVEERAGLLYDYKGAEPGVRAPERFVHVSFRAPPGHKPMSLGAVAVFGTSLESTDALAASAELASVGLASRVLELTRELGGSKSRRRRRRATKSPPPADADTDAAKASTGSPDAGTNSDAIEADADEPGASEAAEAAPGTGSAADVEQYRQAAAQLVASKTKMTLLAALQLDLLRLQLGLSPSQRDVALLALGLRLEFFDPNRFVNKVDVDLVKQLAKSSKYASVICSNSECTNMLSASGKSCGHCLRRFCQDCLDPERHVIVKHVTSVKEVVCMRCGSVLRDQLGVLAQVDELARAQALAHSEAARAHRSLLLTAARASTPNLAPYHEQGTLSSLAQYPAAALLASVPTAAESHPAEVLLFSPHPSLDGLAWRGPDGAKALDLMIVLSSAAMVHSVTIVADGAGYGGESGRPGIHVELAAGATIVDRAICGAFDVTELAPRASHRYELDAPTAPVRILTLTLSLADGEAVGNYLSAGRVVVEGLPVPTPVVSPSPLPYAPAPAPSPALCKILWTKTRNARRTLDFGVEPFTLSGVVLTVRHSDDGPASQVRQVRIVACGVDAKKRICSQIRVGIFVVPMAQVDTVLAFDFEKPVTKANIVTVELLASYGAGPAEPPKVSFY
ncbi:SAC domain-containing protein 9 [Thecamonas trahens ATCC 50062]|uniref:SAC domain-containing protein 9 n=1 Tax=Thecamonas trahens ATCC 50062 TaxID=461836 RepID=A0A0L0DD83_THETB|nr:SAC domain-containing protein 9 [Thecamonas trahens ATCC 50062]KNC50170.1 SAC domain-containing protein 9 [Thecamonas trahens ATCC 50062]|eukprot:XP_013757009.1 SAC domain-containing protein 9 [Thecamonas trahens ATCC 50062]